MNGSILAIVAGNRRELVPMSWQEYLAFPALNGSVIVDGRESMLQLKYTWEYGIPDTDAMQFGRMVHCLLLEPSQFEARYWPWEGTRRGKAYDLLCAEAQLEGAEIVRASGKYSIAWALEAAQSFLRDDRVQELIAAGQGEQAVLAVEYGLQCKGRLDWVSTSEHVLTDLKTTGRIGKREFGAIFFDKGYDLKLGLYQRWLNAVTNDQWPVEVIVLQNKPPFDVATMPIPPNILDDGAQKALGIIEAVRECIETGEWPGVARNKPMELVVPHWAMQEELVEFEG